MTYVIYEPPSARPIFATNSKHTAARIARSLSSASVLGIQGESSRWVHFLYGRRVRGVVENPVDVSALCRARAKRVHGVVELPAFAMTAL